MAELTDEQIKQAAQAADKLMASHGFPTALAYATPEQREEAAFSAMRAAASFLQLPWEEPTSDEGLKAAEYLRRHGSGWSASKVVLMEFVRSRNAALIPNPVDLRRKTIVEVLKQYPNRAPEIADRILAALDEVK